MRGVAIVRVSSKEQAADDRHSIPHQKEHIGEECRKRKIDLVRTFEFVQSGDKVLRASGQERSLVLNYIENNDIQFVIVHELDRLARSMIDTLLFVDELNKRKIAFISVHDGFDTSTAQGQLQMQILAAFAEYFRKQLGSKVIGGMLDRASEAKPMGRRPYGYDISSGRYEINEEEAKVVKTIFKRYVDDNVGLRILAEELNRQGIRTQTGFRWSHVAIRDILDNEIYAGTFIWGEIRIENALPAIVDKELFINAQERRMQKKKLGGKSQNTNFLLSGLSRCGRCEGALVGTSRTHKYTSSDGEVRKYYYRFYRCQTFVSSGRSSCDAGEYKAEGIEKAVLADLGNLIVTMSPDALNNCQIEPVEKEDLKNELANKQKELTRAGSMLDRAAEAFEMGKYDLDFFSRRKEAISNQKNRLREEIKVLERKIENGLTREEILERIKKKFNKKNDFQKMMQEFIKGDMKEERVLQFKKDLQQIISKVEVYSLNEINIYYRL